MPDSSPDSLIPPAPQKLEPVLGRWTAMAIVVGTVIGSGVFLKPSAIAASAHGYVGLILFLWVACGLVNLCGALTYAELATMMPQAGGTYVYLREAFGRLWAFLWGWSEFWVIRSGAVGALSAGMVISLDSLMEMNLGYALSRWESCAAAIGFVVVLTIVNVAGTHWGGWVQNVTTAIKVGFVGLLAILPFLAIRENMVDPGPLFPVGNRAADGSIWLGIGTALAGIMWAYDGWGNISMVAEEIKEPNRNIPWALFGGVVLLILLYVGANLGYHLTLPWEEIAASPVPAVDVMQRLWPAYGKQTLLAMLMISIFGALNANILMGPRVLFAMARDSVFFPPFRHIDPRTGTPAVAIVGLSLWSIILLLLGTGIHDIQQVLIDGRLLSEPLLPPGKNLFDVLTDYCIFGGSIFYLTAVLAVFVLRFKRPQAERPYRTWGYPFVPGVFVAAYVALLVSMFLANWIESLAGLTLIAVGVPAYNGFLRWNQQKQKW